MYRQWTNGRLLGDSEEIAILWKKTKFTCKLHKTCPQINFCWQEKFIFFSIVYLTGSSSFIRYNSPLIPTVCFVLHSTTILPNYIPTCTKYHFLIFISGFLRLFICLFVFIHIIICLI